MVAVAVLVAAAVVGLAALATQDDAPKAAAPAKAATTKPLPGRPALVVDYPAGAPTDPAARVAWARRQTGPDAPLYLAAALSAAGDRAAAATALDGVATPQADAARALLAYDPAAPYAKPISPSSGDAAASPASASTDACGAAGS